MLPNDPGSGPRILVPVTGRGMAAILGHHRPLGVAIIAILNILDAVLILLLLLLAPGLPSVTRGGLPQGLIELILVLLAGLSLAVGIGLWRLRTWAWFLAILLYTVSLIFTACGFTSATIEAKLVQAVITIAIVFYLLQSRIREQFHS